MAKLGGALTLAVCLWASGVAAALPATPSPSPSLDSILAPPPGSDYVERTATAPGVAEGPFDLDGYMALGTSENPDLTRSTLKRDGFISGYGRTWIQRGTQRGVVEAVVAFTGSAGAKKWLAVQETADKSSKEFKASLSIDGITSYYGAHLYSAADSAFIDLFAFVKGNDFFEVIAASGKDDLGDMASVQTKKQYAFAPAGTIPESQWVENTVRSAAYDAGRVAGALIVGVLVLAVIVVVVGLVIRSQRRPAMVATALAQPAFTFSDDGRYWWDGQAWKDAAAEVPPTAQRSPDGRLWWDGRTWRPVP